MSDEEPLYCTQCGREYGCDHSDDDGHGPWCEICGIIHKDDRECPFHESHYEEVRDDDRT